MTRARRLSMCLLFVAGAASCERTNAAYCDANTRCPDGRACDLVAHACAAPASDFAVGFDLAVVVDLAGADLAGADLAGADFAVAADFATPPDLAPPPDLAMSCASSCSNMCVAGGCCADACVAPSGCSQTCTGGCTCTMTCTTTPGNCAMTCSGASTCTGLLSNVNDGALTCSGGSTCDFTCDAMHDCNVVCDATSVCILRCDPADHKCQFTTCAKQMSCPNNVIVCNRTTCP